MCENLIDGVGGLVKVFCGRNTGVLLLLDENEEDDDDEIDDDDYPLVQC